MQSFYLNKNNAWSQCHEVLVSAASLVSWRYLHWCWVAPRGAQSSTGAASDVPIWSVSPKAWPVFAALSQGLWKGSPLWQATFDSGIATTYGMLSIFQLEMHRFCGRMCLFCAHGIPERCLCTTKICFDAIESWMCCLSKTGRLSNWMCSLRRVKLWIIKDALNCQCGLETFNAKHGSWPYFSHCLMAKIWWATYMYIPTISLQF